MKIAARLASVMAVGEPTTDLSARLKRCFPVNSRRRASDNHA
jgi:hypothetical protein